MQMQMSLAEQAFPGVEFDFMDGIHVCRDEDVDGALKAYFPRDKFGSYREWWNARTVDGVTVYERFDDVVEAVRKRLGEKDYDGVVGFSQGGSVAAAVLGTAPPTVKWAWLQSCFLPRHDGFRFSKKGSVENVLVTTHEDDPIVKKAWTEHLARTIEGSTFVVAPGKAHKLVSLKDKEAAHVHQIQNFFSSLSIATNTHESSSQQKVV
eukprot:CAMPEP_0118896660 /NCGR_PEP_ID=MMETSP1166-20130328/4420_1 /TAXON_ID=1104430 /ORGANISM="Chrysoreinhardia sp, Strain CCMP3193" /LENGTH=207 /DNA_ID=CAMNT_0006835719 /DNA_START=107 /DNA_END=730 /DNA_ORIENTATION=+